MIGEHQFLDLQLYSAQLNKTAFLQLYFLILTQQPPYPTTHRSIHPPQADHSLIVVTTDQMRKFILVVLQQGIRNRLLLFVVVQIRWRVYFARVKDYSLLIEIKEVFIGCFGVALDGDPHFRGSLVIRSHYNT